MVAGEHTDRDCKTHLGEKEKIFPYQCSKKRDARGKRSCQWVLTSVLAISVFSIDTLWVIAANVGAAHQHSCMFSCHSP